MSRVRIVSCTEDGKRIVSCAARISTTPGGAEAIYDASTDAEKNDRLIGNVIRSGHRSILEHATLNIALSDVSVVVEQFFIEFRLASFTVKSRRYVDFGGMGYYVPHMDPTLTERYRAHMDSLFETYRYLTDRGIPREDARFVLPYCFYSNFYCSANLRELLHIVYEAKYGRGRHLPELVSIADELLAAISERFPTVAEDFVRGTTHNKVYPSKEQHLRAEDTPVAVTPKASLLNYTDDFDTLLMNTYKVMCGFPTHAELSEECAEKIRSGEAFAQYPRLLEQFHASFLISNITLASLTHLTRHRMQTLIIPDLRCTDTAHYIMPASIAADPEAARRYTEAFEAQQRIIPMLCGAGMTEEAYLCMSGNTIDVMTTMNARELSLFFKLRCCNRAQWEIREIADQMLLALRRIQPVLFSHMGPSCVADGFCPEGKFTCGKASEMRERFTHAE